MREREPEVMPLAIEKDLLRSHLFAVVAAYDRAMLDPAARIPTILHAAIEAAKKALK